MLVHAGPHYIGVMYIVRATDKSTKKAPRVELWLTRGPQLSLSGQAALDFLRQLQAIWNQPTVFRTTDLPPT